MCFLAESGERPCPATATGGRPHLRRYRAELIDGRGYSATLAVEATSRRDAAIEAARYAARHGFRLGRLCARRSG